MFNKCIFVGRISFDLSLKQSGEVSYLTNSLAVKRSFRNGEITDFIPFKVWNKSAEYLSKYAKKGDLILISGELHIDSYTDKEGDNKKVWFINCANVNILSSKKSDEPEKTSQKQLEIEEDGDLPF